MLDELQKRLAQLDSLRQTELRATSLRVASVLAHLLGTPLNVIVGRAALIRADPSPEAVERNARKIEEQVAKLAGRLRGFLDSLSVPAKLPEALTLTQLSSAAVALYGPIATHAGVHLILTDGTAEARSVCDGHAALVVLTALLSLAIRVTAAGGKVALDCASSNDAALFELTVPGLTPPLTPIASVDMPDPLDLAGAIPFQVLSACSFMASRIDGKVTIEALGTGSKISFRCPLAS